MDGAEEVWPRLSRTSTDRHNFRGSARSASIRSGLERGALPLTQLPVGTALVVPGGLGCVDLGVISSSSTNCGVPTLESASKPLSVTTLAVKPDCQSTRHHELTGVTS